MGSTPIEVTNYIPSWWNYGRHARMRVWCLAVRRCAGSSPVGGTKSFDVICRIMACRKGDDDEQERISPVLNPVPAFSRELLMSKVGHC